MPIFTKTEIERRIAEVRAQMSAAGLEAFVATSTPTIYYLTGAPIFQYGRPVAALIPSMGDPVIVCSIIERAHVEAQSPIIDRRYYWDFNDTPDYARPVPPHVSMLRHLARAALELGLDGRRIGYEDWSLSVHTKASLQDALPRCAFVPASDLVERLRRVKSQAEIALIRAADAVADAGEETLIRLLRVGARAVDLHEAVWRSMRDEILEHHADMPFHIRVGTGLGSGLKGAGHSEWTLWGRDDAVEPGQILVTTQTAVLWGYGGNVERAVVIGRPSARIRHDYEVMVEANERAIEAVRPGVPLSKIDEICKEVFTRHGFTTRSGSGLGRGIASFEGDFRELLMDVRLYSDTVLQPGMVFSIEPDLQTEDGTYRHCNTIIVTEDGCIVDSRVDRGLIWL